MSFEMCSPVLDLNLSLKCVTLHVGFVLVIGQVVNLQQPLQ